MIIACLIISSLALLAAAANIILFFVEKKRDQERRHALLDYINNTCNGAQESAENYVEEYVKEFFEKEAELFNTENNEFFVRFSKTIGEQFAQHQKEIDNLKNGAVPDFETAMAAAKAVNDFNAGISAIMNFDPIEAARKRRHNNEEEVG